MESSEGMSNEVAEAYASTYGIFRKRWDFDEHAVLQLLEGHLQRTLPGRSDVSILSVGCGSGEFDAKVIQLVQRLTGRPELEYVGVEPNYIHRRAFERMTHDEAFSAVRFELLPERIEDVRLTRSFDCILYIHSLYHMPGREEALLDDALRLLKDGGCLVLALAYELVGMHKTIRRHQELSGQEGYGGQDVFGASKLVPMLEARGLRCEQMRSTEFIDVSECFVAGSDEGRRLLGFLCYAELSNAPAERVNSLLAYLDELSVTREGRKLLPHDSVALLVSKPSTL
jgi:SAM-dependent methyltransferase